MTKRLHPILLLLLDGWGYREDKQSNAIQQAKTPQWDDWWRNGTTALINCSGNAVGLPDGQMGNSEVGHMHIGAGRVIYQDYTRINHAITSGEFAQNPVFANAIADCQRNASTLHVMGLLSPGGVHSHEQHIFELVKLLAQHAITDCQFHLFLDGRDTPPQSAQASLDKLQQRLKQYPCGRIASMSGRYYAMDRDNRWDRIALVYDLLTNGQAKYQVSDANQALQLAYQRQENDEFVTPTIIGAPQPIKDNDIVIFMNFRADRARQLSRALVESNFDQFTRNQNPKIKLITLTQYAAGFPATCVFEPISLKDTLGECLARAGLTQLRIAETEKYAHVTFFLNGGTESIFTGETRVLIPSPRIATYDLKPEMSAPELTAKLTQVIRAKTYDVIICNFANADMVGHTGNFEATLYAIECLDHCFAQINAALQQVGGELLVTADHGNAEFMFDTLTQQIHTAHTSDPVPFIHIGSPSTSTTLRGSLIDIAPTLLYLLGIDIPAVMQGKPLVKLID